VDLRWIERHRCRRAGIAGENIGDVVREPLVAIEAAFQFQQQHGSAAHQLA